MTTPYGSILYFAVLFAFLIPIVIAGLLGKRLPVYNAFVTLVFIYMMFASSPVQAIALIVFVFWQLALVRLYFNYRQKHNHGGIFVLAVILSILPLFIVKVQPLLAEHTTMLGFLGISYLTFKATQMIMETRDGLIKELNSWDFINFLLFFPTLSSVQSIASVALKKIQTPRLILTNMQPY